VVPAGLSPGESDQLVFVTRDERDTASIDIADYNAFAQAQARLNTTLTGVGVSYYAVASTAAVDANVTGSVPIYLLDGTTKIADGFGDLWDGSIDARLDSDQFDDMVNPVSHVWTGSDITGNVFLPGLGGVSGIINGTTGSFGSGWIFSSINQLLTTEFPFYAIS
jgi:hypothetical protein